MAHAAPPPQSDFTPQKLYMWVKGLESKVNNLIQEVDIIKNDFLEKHNGLKKSVKSLSQDLVEARHSQEKMSQQMSIIIKELKQTAGVEEVMTIKKYLDLWNPLHFVTQNDLQRAVEATVNKGHR